MGPNSTEKVWREFATSDKVTIVVERLLSEGYTCHVRLLGDTKVILRDQVVEVQNVDGRLHVARKQRFHDEWDPYVRRTIRMGQGRV